MSAFSTAKNIGSFIASQNTVYQGYKYQLMSADFDNISSQSIVLADITNISFPTISVEETIVPSLSTKQVKVPGKIIYGDLVLKSVVVRDREFFDQIEQTIRFMKGKEKVLYKNFLICQFANGSLVAKALPISTWLVSNCWAKNLKIGDCDSNQDSINLDELTFSVNGFQKIL